jgi:ubiquinone/menaquinone biosynthesis C-methylase UbiE
MAEMTIQSFIAKGRRGAARFRHHLGQSLRHLLPALRPRPPAANLRFGYRPPVVDLGDQGGERVRGIFSPCYDPALVRRYIQAQFLENAATYAERYAAVDLFKDMLERAFAAAGLSAEQRRGLKILDIGSGSGNTIFPLLELCPDSDVLGSDLSADILVLLMQALVHKGIAGKCCLLQLNAEELDFQPETFDLVVGGAILHHLIRPELAIAGCAKILKKGGHAIFFEPFQEGHVELRDCYADILADPRSAALTDTVRNFFRAMINDVNVRLGTDKSDPIYTRLDDKWLFPKEYVFDLARRHGFSSCQIDFCHPYESRLKNKTISVLRLGIQHTPEQVPAWVWQVVKKHDEAVPPERQSDLLIEGTIILRR